MIDFLDTLDSNLLLALNSLHCEFFDRFMTVATGRFVWVPFYAAVLFMLIHRFGWRRGLIWVAMIALAVTAADQMCATVIRPLVCRMRPANEMNPLSHMVHIVDGYRGGLYGFPSCHGSNSFALVMLVCLIFRTPRVWVLMVGWALINVYTRIYLGVHYPGDILTGTLIGILFAILFYRVGRLSISRFNIPSGERDFVSFMFPTAIHPNGAVGMSRVRFSTALLPVTVLGVTILAIAVASI